MHLGIHDILIILEWLVSSVTWQLALEVLFAWVAGSNISTEVAGILPSHTYL